jgi:DeoR family transcriptional regulator, fructose operon transcriptional repressor
MIQQLNDRQEQILKMINRQKEIKVSELSHVFGVAEMTIRRDLEKMEQLGMIRRTFGGAIPVTSKDIDLWERARVMMEEKEQIGQTAARRIKPGEAIFIDAGSTTLQVARHLDPNADVTVVTNALNVTNELANKGISAIVVGGLLRKATSSLVGPIAEEVIRKMAFDQVFLGASGVTVEHGFSNSNVFEAELKRLVISKAKKVNVVIDHSKFGIQSLASFAELHQVHHVYTDRAVESGLITTCRQSGIEIIASNSKL